MKTEFSKAELVELVPPARAAVETEPSLWVQLGNHFRAEQETADRTVAARPIRKPD